MNVPLPVLPRVLSHAGAALVPLAAALSLTGEAAWGAAVPDVLAEERGRMARLALAPATPRDSVVRPELPAVPGLSLAAWMRSAGPHAGIGGDFYDVVGLDGGGCMVVFGDVGGKGPSAAAIRPLVLHTARNAARHERSPARVLELLNERLVADLKDGPLCTAVCVRLEPVAGGMRAVVASAGHPPPMLLRRSGWVSPAGIGGVLLGALTDHEWPEAAVWLGDGDTLVLYTDGVTDAVGATGRFGVDRFVELLADECPAPAETVSARIAECLREFQVGEQADDIALLVIEATC